MAQLEFELASYDVTVEYVSHYTSRTPTSIMVVGTLTHFALFQSVCDLKVLQMNVQDGLIQKFYKFELGQNDSKATKTFIVRKVNVQLMTVE